MKRRTFSTTLAGGLLAAPLAARAAGNTPAPARAQLWETGGCGYGPSLRDSFRRAATYVDTIFKVQAWYLRAGDEVRPSSFMVAGA
jgi:hypothetical protein